MRVNDEEFLQYYQRELTYLRRMGGYFAQRYPKIAGRLELSTTHAADPNVERLLEAFAFLTARLQYNIDAEFPEITSALLNILYPHYLTPIPSMAIAQFGLDTTQKGQAKVTSGYEVKPHTKLYTESADGVVCKFRTAYPVTIWPIEVAEAEFEATDHYDFLDSSTQVATILRLKLRCLQGSFKELELKRLRFFLHGPSTTVSALYELLFGNVFRVVALPPDRRPIFLPPENIRPVGFETEEALFPYPRNAHPAYRLLQEYFTFPEKFHFFEIDQLRTGSAENEIDLLILFNQLPKQRLNVNRETFALGCTPIINLFSKTCEPIRLDHRTVEYRLNPDMRRERSTEIHTILKISGVSNPEDETQTFAPFYSYNHAMETTGHSAFWFARRQATGRPDLPGSEMMLSLLDLNFQPSLPANQVIFAHTLCTNRYVANEIQAGSPLQPEEAPPSTLITCLTKPTPQIETPLASATAWKLISHLSLNYLSLTEGKESLKALHEILQLYSFSDRPSSYQQILGIRELSTRRVVRQVGEEAWRGFCRGIEVRLTFDETAYVGHSAFLLASVLNRFFPLYTSINSFTQLVILSHQREGVWKQWSPMVGGQIIL